MEGKTVAAIAVRKVKWPDTSLDMCEAFKNIHVEIIGDSTRVDLMEVMMMKCHLALSNNYGEIYRIKEA
jgi:hypothetical protein